MTVSYPPKLTDLVVELTAYGWSFMLNHGKDTGNSPFVSVEARRENEHIMITWHTRATGTYRLFSCLVNKHDATLTKAFGAVTA